MSDKPLFEKLHAVRKAQESIDVQVAEIQAEIERSRDEYKQKLVDLSESMRLTQLESSEFAGFLEEPYAIVPSGKQEEWFVVVPKFVRMNLGWLDFTTPTYNVFRINKFANWLGDIPMDIQKRFKFKPKLPLKVYDGMVLTGPEHQEEAWGRYSEFLTRREGSDKLRIKQGQEFRLIAKLIDDGILPFIPRPIAEEDLRVPVIKFEMRDYQKAAWEKFKETGAVGIYWAFSAGKTFFGMYAAAAIKGPKLVVVPTVTLVEQWKERFRSYTQIASEVDVVTYRAFEKCRNRKFSLVIYDESHHLPANMFSKLATLDTKYRIGLSGTPYREDGRTDYIFALTGFPIGLSWETLIELGIIEEPDIRIFIFGHQKDKEAKLRELLGVQRKTIIFCDSINTGQRLSRELELPFVYGSTRNRMEIIRESETTIVSRVGDEGLSIPDIERVIEFDFLFGSRRQEGQRMGRLFHGKGKGEHVVLMTEEEYDAYSKRLFSLYEKGFKVEVIRA
jgi:DNA excision repair protein ERCC-3